MVLKKKLLILSGVILASVIVLVVIGMFAYNKATNYIAAKAIVEFGKMYETMDDEERQKLDDFLNSLNQLEADLANEGENDSLLSQEQSNNSNNSVGQTSGSSSSNANSTITENSSIAVNNSSGESSLANTNNSPNGNSSISNGSNSSGGSNQTAGNNSSNGNGQNQTGAGNSNNQQSGGNAKSIAELEKIVTQEDKDTAISIVLSKMSMDEVMDSISMLGGRMSGEKYEEFKKIIKNKFTTQEILTIKKLYDKYMS